MTVTHIDPATTAGIALTALSYALIGSFLGLLGQVIFTPYILYIAIREYGVRFILWPRELAALRQKYPLYRFAWNLSCALGLTFILSLFGMVLIAMRYSL